MMAGQKPDNSGVLWSIQYLRAAAAIAVVVFHQTQDFGPAFHVGAHGVDLFFVISGFIMVKLTNDRPTSPVDFALDRISRIAPPYWLATIATFGLVIAGKYMWNTSSDPVLLAKSLLFIPARNEFGFISPTLFLGWTLAFEMFFYAIFALVLFAKRWRVAILSAVLGTLVVLGAIFQPREAIAATYSSPLLLAFLAGAVLGQLSGIKGYLRTAGSLAVAGILAVLSLHTAVLVYAAISVLIMTVALAWESMGTLPQARWLKSLGDASFAIYLFQQFGFRAVEVVAARVYSAPIAVIKGASILAAISLGLLIFRFVERPLTKATRNLIRRCTRHDPVLRPQTSDA